MTIVINTKCARRTISFLLLASWFAACSSDKPPSGAIEAEISVVVLMGERDPDRGRLVSSQINVVIDGARYPLEPISTARVIGFEGEDRIALAGRKVIVAGSIEDGIYRATYAKLLKEVAPTAEKSTQPPELSTSINNEYSVSLQREILELDEQIKAAQREIELQEEYLNNSPSDDPRDKMEQQARRLLIETKKTALETMKAHRDLQEERKDAIEARRK